MANSQRAIEEKANEIERIIQENERNTALTNEALEAKRQELAATKAALESTTNQADASKKLAQIIEEKQMFQTELLGVTEQLHETQNRLQFQENRHAEELKAATEKSEQAKSQFQESQLQLQALKEESDAVQNAMEDSRLRLAGLEEERSRLAALLETTNSENKAEIMSLQAEFQQEAESMREKLIGATEALNQKSNLDAQHIEDLQSQVIFPFLCALVLTYSLLRRKR